MPLPRIYCRWVVVVLMLYAGTGADILLAQEDDSSAVQSGAESEKGEKAFQKWAFFPVIASDAETSLMLGGMVVRFFEPASPEMRTDTVDLALLGTIEEQYRIFVMSNHYLKEDRYHLKSSVGGALWPSSYYGVGNDTPETNEEEFEAKSLMGSLFLERRFAGAFYAGVGYKLRYEDLKTEEDGLLESNDVTGTDGGLQSGLGLVATWDSRDNLNDARSGTLIKFKSTWFRPAFGSDYSFEQHDLELCRYIALTETTGLALGGQVNLARGDIPFEELNSPDGRSLLRGIENGRYRDRDMAALQAEYRFPIAGRWGAAFFAETAQVAPELGELEMDAWKYSLGGGIRYALNPSERFNLRLDLSYVDDGVGFVINFREAF